MFDKGVRLRRKWDLQNINVHPSSPGDAANATAIWKMGLIKNGENQSRHRKKA